MAKVLIYEDSGSDLTERYAHLTAEHDVHVRYLTTFSFMSMSLEETIDHAREHGFKPENIKELVEGDYDPKDDSADVYFLDGLGGYCLDLIKLLPKDRAFINSCDHSLVKKAKAEGYNVIEREPVKSIVERLSQ